MVCVLDEKQHECLRPVVSVSRQRGLSKGVVSDVSKKEVFHGFVIETFPS